MYFVGIMIFIIVGNIILFFGNGLNDLCNWRDAKDSWNPYTQSKNKYWIDHKGRRRLTKNGKEYTYEQQRNDILTEQNEKKEKYRQNFNKQNEIKAKKEGKSVFEYDIGEQVVDYLNKRCTLACKGIRYKDVETGDIYVKRKFGYLEFYMNSKTGIYVRETDETQELKEDNSQKLRIEIRKECKKHNENVLSGNYLTNDELYDNGRCLKNERKSY